MGARQVVIFVVFLGVAFALLGGPAGVMYTEKDRPRLTIKQEEQPSSEPAKKPVRVRVGRPAPEPGVELSDEDAITQVDVPIIGQTSGREEGRLTGTKMALAPGAKAKTYELHLSEPIVTLYAVDRETGAIDATQSTRITAKTMVLDREIQVAHLRGDVVMRTDHEGSRPQLVCQEVALVLESREMYTRPETAVEMQWGPTTTVTGRGLVGASVGERATLRSQGRIMMQLQDGRPVTPSEPAGDGKTSQLIANCDGPLTMQRQQDGLDRVELVGDRPGESGEVIAGKAQAKLDETTIDGQKITLWLRTHNDRQDPNQPGGIEDARDEDGKRKILLKRMLAEGKANERVTMTDPENGEGKADSLELRRGRDERETISLIGRPTMILQPEPKDGEQGGLFGSGGDVPEGAREVLILKSRSKTGRIVYDRLQGKLPTPAETPDLLRVLEKVQLDRQFVSDAGTQRPLRVRCDELLVRMDRRATPRSSGRTKVTSQMREAIASGEKVTITETTSTIIGKRAHWRFGADGKESMEVTESPTLVVRKIEDDDAFRINKGDPPPADAKPKLVDLRIECKRRMTIGAPAEDGSRQLRFYEDVKVERYPYDERGRVARDPLPSKLFGDELDVLLVKGKDRAGKEKMQLGTMVAKGNAKMVDVEATATGDRLTFDQAKNTVTMIGKVLLVDKDGGEYRGLRLDYDRGSEIATLHGTEKQPADVLIPVNEPAPAKGAPPAPPRKGPKKKHHITAPRIDFDRKKGEIVASGGGVNGLFYPGKNEQRMFDVGGKAAPPKAPKPGDPPAIEEEPTPWRLTCDKLIAWLEKDKEAKAPREPGDPQPPAGGRASLGKIRRIEALASEFVPLTVQSVLPEGQRGGSQTATGARMVHEKVSETVAITTLYANQDHDARTESDREALISKHQIRFLHDQEIVLCPRGGRTTFLEQVDGAKPRPVEISCTGEIRFKRGERAIFQQAVRIRRDDAKGKTMTMEADKVVAELTQVKDAKGQKQTQIKRATATGKEVKIISGSDTAFGQKAVWGAVAKTMVLTAAPGRKCRMYTRQGRFRTAEVHFDQDTGEARARGGMEKLD